MNGSISRGICNLGRPTFLGVGARAICRRAHTGSRVSHARAALSVATVAHSRGHEACVAAGCAQPGFPRTCGSRSVSHLISLAPRVVSRPRSLSLSTLSLSQQEDGRERT